MRPSKWLVFIRPSLAGFDRPLTVIHPMLQGFPKARGIDEIASVIAKGSGWMEGKKFPSPPLFNQMIAGSLPLISLISSASLSAIFSNSTLSFCSAWA